MKPIRIYRKYSNPSFPLLVNSFPVRREMSYFINIHWHPEPELLYAEEGDYEIYRESGNFLLKEGEICLIPPSKVHAIRSLTPKGHYHSISFSMDLIQMPDTHYFQQDFVAPLKSGNLQFPAKFTCGKDINEKSIQALESVINGSQNQQFIGLLSFLLEIMPICKKLSLKRDLSLGHAPTTACINYMEANFRSKITLEELAKYVHLHPNYLCSIFKKNTGKTIFEYLNTLRVRKSRTILTKSNLSIAQIAEQVGFTDTDHFSRTFKQVIGLSPSAFKKMYNEN